MNSNKRLSLSNGGGYVDLSDAFRSGYWNKYMDRLLYTNGDVLIQQNLNLNSNLTFDGDDVILNEKGLDAYVDFEINVHGPQSLQINDMSTSRTTKIGGEGVVRLSYGQGKVNIGNIPGTTRLNIEKGSDVDLRVGGSMMIGSPNEYNMAFGTQMIPSQSKCSSKSLLLNPHGGNVGMEPYLRRLVFGYSRAPM